jgi:hypothetical protein
MREVEAAIVQVTIKQNICQLFSDYHISSARLIFCNDRKFFCFCKDGNQEWWAGRRPLWLGPAVQRIEPAPIVFIEADDAPASFLASLRLDAVRTRGSFNGLVIAIP